MTAGPLVWLKATHSGTSHASAMPKIVYEVRIVRKKLHNTRKGTYQIRFEVPRSHNTSIGIDLHGWS